MSSGQHELHELVGTNFHKSTKNKIEFIIYGQNLLLNHLGNEFFSTKPLNVSSIHNLK